MRWLEKCRFRPLRGQGGLTLIEVVVAVAILGAIGVTFISAIGAGYKSVTLVDEKTQAEALIRSQLDDIEASDYEITGVYPVTVDVPYQYSVSIDVQVLDTETCFDDGNCDTLQMITVVVSRPGGTVKSVSTYKVKN